MLLEDAMQDHDQNEYQQGYDAGQDNGGDGGGDFGGDDGGGDFWEAPRTIYGLTAIMTVTTFVEFIHLIARLHGFYIEVAFWRIQRFAKT